MVKQWNSVQFGWVEGVNRELAFSPSSYHLASFQNLQVMVDGRGRDLQSLHDFTQTDILNKQHADNLESGLVAERLMEEG